MFMERVCRRIYCLVSDRLVYRVHVVTDHGYPYAAFSQNSLLQSRPAWLVLVTTLLAAAFVTFLPYSPLAILLHLTPLKPIYFIFLLFIIILYMISVTIVKKIYIKKYQEWL